MLGKNELRKRYLQKLKKVDVSKKSKQVVQHYLKSLHRDHYKRIGLYISFQNEVMTKDLIESLLQRGIKVFVPHISSHRDKDLKEYRLDEPLIKNKMGFLEPKDSSKSGVDDLDIIIIPLLAFDLNGRRLGRGGGFYDQLLTSCQTKIVGFAYDSQRDKDLPYEAWDVCMDYVVTESGVVEFNKN